MKKILFAVVFGLMSATSFADTSSAEATIEMSCMDARPILDDGIAVFVKVQQDGQILEVNENTMKGPRPIGAVPVRQSFSDVNGNKEIFSSRGVELVIDLESTGARQWGFVRGVVNGVRLDHDVRCKRFAREQ